jgi:hypothetical protein
MGFNGDGEPDGSLTADLYNPGVSVYGAGVQDDAYGANTPVGPLVSDHDGDQLAVVRDATSYAADQGKGVLLFHYHNKVGDKAQVVALRESTAVTLSAAPTTLVRGNPVSLTVTVPQKSGGPVPTGTVSVLDSTGKTVASGPLGSTGSAKLSYKPAKPGTLVLHAAYAGDGTYAASTSSPVTVHVTKAASKLRLALSGHSGKVGKRVSATVSITTVAGIPATGKVVLKNGSKTVGSGRVSNGRARITFVPKKAGKLHLRAVYAGDATYNAGTSNTATYTVKKAKRH